MLSQRRHHRERMLKRAKRMISIWEYNSEHLEWRAVRIYNNMKNCSCWMCRNERTNGWNSNRMKLSMQERRAEDDYKDQINEI